MPITNLPIRSFIGVATALLIAAPTHAHQHEQAVRATIGSHISEWLHTPLVVDAIKRQNAEHASISAADIGHVDKQWRAQTKQASRPLIDKVMARLLSRYLKEV